MNSEQISLERRRQRHRERLAEAVKRIVNILAELPQVQQIILFGSYSRGQVDLFTDLDLLVVMDTQEDLLTRTVRLYRLLGGKIGIDLDLLVYTPQELKEARSGFLRAILQEGKVIYARSGDG